MTKNNGENLQINKLKFQNFNNYKHIEQQVMKKDITLLEEYKDILDNRIKELEEEQKLYVDNYAIYSNIQNRILELQSQWYAVQGLIIKNI